MQCIIQGICSFPKGHSHANKHYSIPAMPSRKHVLQVALHMAWLEFQLLSVFSVTKDPTSTKLQHLCLSINTDFSPASALLTEDGKGRGNTFRAVTEQRLNTHVSFSLPRMQEDAVTTSSELFTHICSPCMPRAPEARPLLVWAPPAADLPPPHITAQHPVPSPSFNFCLLF